MAKLSTDEIANEQHERDKQKLQQQQEQYRQLQRDLADAISRLASLDDIRILLACGAKADGPVTQGLHPIHYAAYQNFVPAVRLLILRGCDVNAMDDNGYTPVHLAAERGYRELLEFLVANGARVCFTDLRRQSNLNNNMADEPLCMALKRGHLECAELLLANGADPNARYFMGSEINLVNILKVSAIRLLLKYGAKPDTRDRSGLTPLMKAARHPEGYATVKLLIEHGADVNDITGERHDYRTVLHHSIFSGNLELIRLLLTSGARYPKLDFDKPSPLDIAIISGREDIVALLVEFDADVNGGQRTTIGQPLHTALTQRFDSKREIVRLLLAHGADPNSLYTSNRQTGPPLHDYLHSVRHGEPAGPSGSPSSPGGRQRQPRPPLCPSGRPPPTNNSSSHLQQQQQPPPPSEEPPQSAPPSSGPDLELIRMLLMYGARVILKTPSQHPLGLVRTLERVQDELDLELLSLLIEAAEEIDWFMMSKVIYACLRRTNRAATNELFDPSVAADMTPQRLAQILADPSAHYQGIPENLIRLINGGRGSSSVLSLKQTSRIQIRNHLIERLGLKGRSLVDRINQLDVPLNLRRYLLYQT